MRERLTRRAMGMVEALHRRLFRHEMSDEMRLFLGQLSWSFLGGILASAIMFLVSILAGRWLGPEEYGRYNSLLSLATAFSTVCLLGINVTSVRYLADEEFAAQQREILSSAIWAVAGWSSLLVVALVLLRHPLQHWLAIPPAFFWTGIGLSLALSGKGLADGFLRATHRIRVQSLLRVVEALLVLILFCSLLWGASLHSYLSYAVALLSGETLYATISLLLLTTYLTWFSLKLFRRMFGEYNRFLLISSLLGTVMFTDKYLIGRLIGVRELGIYSAYYSASHLIVAELSGIFMNVFWPSVIKNVASLRAVMAKIGRIFLGFSGIFVLLIMANTSLFVWFFGHQYPFFPGLIFLFSLNTFMGVLFTLYSSFLNISHVRLTVYMNAWFTVTSIGSLFLLRRIEGYLLVQILAQAVAVWVVIRFLRKVADQQVGQDQIPVQ